MTLEIPSNKLYNQSQTLSFESNKAFCLIGENGSGKSSILESIFNSDSSLNIITFSSGQNEGYSQIYEALKRSTFKSIQNIDENFSDITKYYFDSSWIRALVFFASSLKHGKVKAYLSEKNYIDIQDDIDISSSFKIPFAIPDYYIRTYKQALEKEAIDPTNQSVRNTYIQRFLENIAETINEDYAFEKPIKSTTITLNASDTIDIFGRDFFKLFTFISLTNIAAESMFDYSMATLYFKNGLEFGQLSDGEYQLLSIYALIDLFDSSNTLFLFDEIDSHVHFGNLNKLWDTLKSIHGKLISTTHISESILKNNFDSLLCVESGKINKEITALESLKKISNVANNEKFIFNACQRIKHIALIDDESDWEIFKQLAVLKIGEDARRILDKVVPIKITSSYNFESQLFGNEKIEFVRQMKNHHITHLHSVLQNIFMICDKDEYPESSIKENDIECKQTDKLSCLNDIKTFGNNSKSYLLSWRRREILHYLLSYTMIEHYEKIDDFKQIISYLSDVHKNQNFDNDQNIKTASKVNVKFIKKLMQKDNGGDNEPNWTDYNKLKEVVSKVPPSEISEDIVKMYNFIKAKVEANG